MDHRKKSEMVSGRNKKGDELRGKMPIKFVPFKLIEGYSKKKCEVMCFALSGHTNKVISSLTGISEKTVERYIAEMRSDGHYIPYMLRTDTRTREGLQTVYVTIPETMVKFLTAEAQKRKVSRGTVIREVLEWGLEATDYDGDL